MKICVNAICKNELKNLEEWLNSFSAADYIAILDTGSTDGTWERLQELAKESSKLIVKQEIIKPFHFDVARNTALKLVPQDADFILCADFDERINQGWVDAFNHISEESNIYKIYRRDVTPEYIGVYCAMNRVLRNNGQTRWWYPVHETLGDFEENATWNHPCLDIYMEHYEDNDPNKWQWYNDLLAEKMLKYPRARVGALQNLAYQNQLLTNYQLSWKYMQEARELFENTPEKIRQEWDWHIDWVLSQWERYKIMASRKVAVYAITKDELQFVDKWMKSMWEADYICILDTGSTDGTYEKLQEYQKKNPEKVILSQKIYKPWRFDTPRNDSMKLVPKDADFCICTDFDEILINDWSHILKEAWDDSINRLYYLYAWSHNSNGDPARVFWYDKCHSNDGTWSWEFPVHECLKCTKEIKGKNIDDKYVLLHHYPVSKASRGNYLSLLELRAEENPDDYYGLVYLAHEYMYAGKVEKCLEFSQNLIAKINLLNDDMNCVTDLYMFVGDAYARLGKLKEAEESYLWGIKRDKRFRDNYIQLSRLYINQKRYQESVDILQKCLQDSRRLYSWLERDNTWGYEIWDLLCLAYYNIGAKHASLDCAELAYLKNPADDRLKYNVEVIKKELKVDK